MKGHIRERSPGHWAIVIDVRDSQTGKMLNLSRGGTYAAAARGDIKTIQLGRLKRVPSAWLKAKLGLDEPGA